jgi:quaternary ammonium compound-resistance protein SugE
MRRRRKAGGQAGRIIPQLLSVEGAAVKIARMPWLYLLIAGVMEWGWPIGLKFAALPQHRQWAITLAIVSIILSGVFLFLAQRTIPIGTAYAVWTGIGAVGTFLLGILLFDEPAAMARFLFVGLILVGIAGLKLSSY